MALWDEPWPNSRPVSGWAYGQLLAAEEGRLHYDAAQYPVHGVSNTTVQLIWGGLLADGHGQVVLTDTGRARLEQEKLRQLREDEQEAAAEECASVPVLRAAAADVQLDLFGNA